ncbi:DUF4198 domain-containing protein [Snodgrassella sp. CFCC 13594]|jgi:uncharacterized GH25 family protein|uniref:DUF4198 domain-containing protein n=1 Tax=Snodgrassella sp. CFCC 13594 TaxID=1775559 RepID=UPI0008353828
MKAWKASLAVAVLGSWMGSVPVWAHEVWVNTDHTHGGETLKAELAYGHFPAAMTISAERQDIFKKPLQLIGPQGKQNLLQKGLHNYSYQSAKPLPEGSYLVLAEYAPTFWSKNAQGWRRANLQQMPDATYCEETRMFGKNVLNVGHDSADTKIITQPTGQALEIVPLDNPANVQVGKSLPVQVLYQGEPLANATVVATFDGFTQRDADEHNHDLEPQAFSATTDGQGKVGVIPLRQGFWKVRVVHKAAYGDAKICQFSANYATLTFQIGHVH